MHSEQNDGKNARDVSTLPAAARRVVVQLREAGQLTAAIAIYAGKERAVDRGIRVSPFVEFARELVSGRVLG